MSINIKDNNQEIIIINDETTFAVSNKKEITNIVDNNLCFNLTDKVGELIYINATDVIISNPVTAVDIPINCSANEQIGDAVYLFGVSEVRKASNTNINTAKVIGFVSSKITSTTCKIRISGLLSNLTLNTGAYYFLGTNGGITTIPPVTQGAVLSRVGQAINNTDLLININNNYIIRS